jgi:hypothetical protein
MNPTSDSGWRYLNQLDGGRHRRRSISNGAETSSTVTSTL